MHYYDGNRGPLYHLADKVEVSPEEVEARKPSSWWYKRAAGGGSLLDYLGYGVTLGTWFVDGEAPIEVTSRRRRDPGDRGGPAFDHGLPLRARPVEVRDALGHADRSLDAAATAEMRLRAGRHGTASISSYDYDDFVTLQTRKVPAHTRVPVDSLPPGRRAPIEYMLARIDDGAPISGPLDPALCLIGQRIIDSAVLSAATKRTVGLVA